MDIAATFDERSEPGVAPSIVLAAAVHVLLAAILLLGVRWQNRPPDAIVVELWSELPALERPEPPKPAPEAPPAEAPKPEPRIEKPDIAIKEPAKPRSKPEVKPKPEPRPGAQPRPEPARAKPREEEAQKRLREELAREQVAFALERERQQIREQLARDGAAASARGLEEYTARIRAKVRGNWILPPELKGNPEAVFNVVQLPSGEVLTLKLVRSSGVPAYDQAVERAILKSSPLPKPDRPELFSRELKLTFRPRD